MSRPSNKCVILYALLYVLYAVLCVLYARLYLFIHIYWGVIYMLANTYQGELNDSVLLVSAPSGHVSV
jgi:hypothetical protein